MTPFVSSILAQNCVFLIISLNISLSNDSIARTSSFSEVFGKSSASCVTISHFDVRVFMTSFSLSSTSIEIGPAGSFLIMSEKILACTTVSPGISVSAGIVFSMLMSRSDAERTSFPSSVAFINIPFSIGIVVLVVIAFETVLSAFESCCCSHVNLMVPPRAILLYLFSSNSSIPC